jgi:mono/diheme cytochrome c family protein
LIDPSKERVMKHLLLAGLLLVPTLVAAQASPAEAASRGRLLYDTHCIACHNEQVHWRERKLASDWPSLVAEVRRWQTSARLQWNESDIDQVARYLNETIYRYAAPSRATAMR